MSAEKRNGRKYILAAKVGIGMVALFITVAGAAKIKDIDVFRQSLESWSLIPVAVRSTVATVVPILEIGLGFAWLLGLNRRILTLLIAGLLICFTSVYAIHRIAGYAPDCQCLGKLLRVQGLEHQADVLIWRNGVLIGVLGIGWMIAYRRQGQSRPKAAVTSGLWHQRNHRGFTLVETLVSVAVIAMLISILIPVLARVRGYARESVDRSNLRQHAVILTQYTGDWSGAHPLFLDPSQAISSFRWESRETEIETSYFLSCQAWPMALADAYYEGQVVEGAFWSPKESQSRAEAGDTFYAITSYSYPCSFIARPSYWKPETRLDDPAKQTGLTRASEVRFPSAKALLVLQTDGLSGLDDLSASSVSNLTVALYDGSANGFSDADGVAAVVDADGAGARLDWSYHIRDWPRLHHTPDGILGRDIVPR